jgi:hypothetical protein
LLGGAAGNPPITYQKSASLFQPWIRHRNLLLPISRIFYDFPAFFTLFRHFSVRDYPKFSHHLYHYPSIVKQLAAINNHFPPFLRDCPQFSHHWYHYPVILNHFPPDLYHFSGLFTIFSSFVPLSRHRHIQPVSPPIYLIVHSFLIICTIILSCSTIFPPFPTIFLSY